MNSLYLLTLFMILSPALAHAGTGDGGIFVVSGNISTRAYAHFIIEDATGKRTGQLLDGTRVAEIPETGGAYGIETEDTHDSNEKGLQSIHFEMSRFPPGKYQLKLLPTATTFYWMKFTIRNDNFTRFRLNERGFATAGTTITYSFDFTPTASSPTPIAKAVTFDSLRRSVLVALQVGQIGDAAFVSRLDKMLIKAQSFAETTGAKKQAADRLDQFIHRIDSAFKKEPDPDDGDDPQDKKGTPIVNRFSTKTARDSLSEDARILIRGLGETPKR